MRVTSLHSLKLIPAILLALAVWLVFTLPALAQGPVATGPSPQLEPGQTPAGLTAVEWDNIQNQITADRYRPRADEAGGYVSSNPAHGWQIDYAPAGATTLTGNGDWQWGLRLTAYGYGQPAVIAGQPTLHSAEGQLTYHWDANLREWWVNTPTGLEQGFTLQSRPATANGSPLMVEMAVQGDLTPQLRGDGIVFTDAAGAVILTYNKLHVTDAAGQVIPARFAVTGQTLRILVDDAAAIYPLTIDPLVQQAYLKASNAEASDQFGYSVAISGDTLVVGANAEDSSAAGGESDNSVSNTGAVYVFVRSGTTWSQQAYLKASNAEADDQLGRAVAISGDTVVVGALFEDSSAGGGESDNSTDGAGAAYVFVRSGTTWSQQAYLKASNAGTGDNFGNAVSISGDTLVVGAWYERSSATGGESDNSAFAAGAAYVFVRSGTTWSQQAYLKASNAEMQDNFGYAVAVSGDTLVVGAYAEDSSATGGESDNSASNAGAAYVFVRSGTTWSQQAYLKASNAGASDTFGCAAAIDGDTLVVGAYGEGSNATGVNGDQTNNLAGYSGAAYVFTRSGTTWSQQAYLKASNTGASDNFGIAAAIDGDTVVVGANGESSSATGGQSDNSVSFAGAAYVFTRSAEGTWSQQPYLKAPNAETYDSFGYAVAVSGDTLVVGATGEDSSATGGESDNSVSAAGAAYVFVVPPPPDVTISKSVSPPSAKPGEAITYTLTFSNAGLGTGTGVVITDSVPVSVTNVSVISSGVAITATGAAPNFGWQVADLAPDEGGVITLTGVLSSPLAAGIFTNTAEIAATGDSDPANNTGEAGLSVQNVAPVAVDDPNESTAEDTALTISPLTNDTDANGGGLTVSAVGSPAHGTVSISGSRQVVYTPTLNFNGVDTFTYLVSDGSLTDTAAITVTVNPVNDAPRVVELVVTFVTKWGSMGTGDGQLKQPSGVAVDGSGNVYVVDTNNHRIQKFDSSGTYLTQWGSKGSSNGQFNTPFGVAVDSSGNIYVSDTFNNRIQKFDSSGAYLSQWGSAGSGNGQFNFPTGVAVDAGGHVYVADAFNDRLQKFDNSGVYLAQWGSAGSGNGEFNRPFGVAVTGSGYVYVADTNNHRLQKFDSSGGYLTQSGSNGSGDGQFDTPGGVAVDGSGYVYVADTNNHRIQRFSTIAPITQTGVTMSEDGSPNPFSLTLYATDADGDPLTWSILTPALTKTATISQSTSVTATLAYTPYLNWSGVDSFTVQVSDGSLTDTVAVSVTVESVNDAPVAVTDTITTTEDVAVTISPLLNDTDVESDTLTLPAGTLGSPAHGTAVISGSTQVVYTPTLNFAGTDSFTYTVSEVGLSRLGGPISIAGAPSVLTSIAIITVTVTNVNDAPVITNSTPVSVTMSEDGSPDAFSLTLYANDPDTGDTLTWSIVTQAISGTATASGTGRSKAIGYTPDADWHGDDSFTVQVSDGSLTDTVAVSVTVESVNDAPIATNDTALVMRTDTGDLTLLGTTSPVTIPVLVNDTDPDSGNNIGLTVIAVGSPSQGGSAAANSNGRLVDYTPPTATFTGTETFTYTVSDGGLTDTATVTVTVVNGDGGGSTQPDDSGGETIIVPDTGISGTITVTVQIPAGMATDTFALVYNKLDAPSGQAPDGFVPGGIYFELDAYLNQALQAGYVFTPPITITFEYSDADVANIPGGENSLELFYWDGSNWSSGGITVVQRDTDNNRLIVSIAHLTEFALFGRDITPIYLPVIVKNFVSAPDLVITELVATGGQITVTVKNQGNTAVTEEFWLDVYFNPTSTPGLNKPWQNIAPAGATWGVTAGIPAGDSLTLTVGDGYYVPQYSSSSFPTGAQVYGYVDSVNYATGYGAIYESNEGNNLFGPVTSSAGSAATSLNSQSAGPELANLPQR